MNPAQQVQMQRGEHKSVVVASSEQFESAPLIVCSSVSILGAASAQGMHDNTIM